MNRDEHDFIFELARTTPFSYVTLLGSFQSFCEHVKNKDTTMEVKMKSFRSVLKVSQATLVPLPNVVALVGRELRRKPSWFQRLKNWFVGIKNKIKKWWAGCEHKFNTRGYMPLHGDDSGMRDQCTECKKWVTRK